MPYAIDLFDCEFSPFEQLAKRQKIEKTTGAQSVFVGYMRDFREHQKVSRMMITDYPPMTQMHLETLAQQALEQFFLIDLYIAHRVGAVFPTSPLVVVSALASHRANAIRATASVLESLKHNVPLWKKEYALNSDKGSWVQGNTRNRIKS